MLCYVCIADGAAFFFLFIFKTVLAHLYNIMFYKIDGIMYRMSRFGLFIADVPLFFKKTIADEPLRHRGRHHRRQHFFRMAASTGQSGSGRAPLLPFGRAGTRTHDDT